METKKIALFGTNTQALWCVVEETLKRGHSVTAIVNNPADFKLNHPRFSAARGNIMRSGDIAKHAEGNDLVICIHDPVMDPFSHLQANEAVISGAKYAGVHSLISLGHPVSLKLENSEDFYEIWKPIAEAQLETLNLYKNEHSLNWSYIHSIDLYPKKKDNYTLSEEVLISTEEGMNKVIEIDQLMDALLNEIDKHTYSWQEIQTHL